MSRRIRAVAFDLDDTLYPERDFVRSGFAAVGDWLHRRRGGAGFADAAWSLFEEGCRGDVFDRALPKIGIAPEASLLGAMVRVYREHKPSGLRLFPDAAQALRELKSVYALGLITDGFATTQRNKIEALGLEKDFSALICSDQWGRDYWKPDPRPYLELMARFSLAGDECAYVGDNPAKDFAGAKALGWRVLQVKRPDGLYRDEAPPPGGEPDLRLDSLDRLRQFLGSP